MEADKFRKLRAWLSAVFFVCLSAVVFELEVGAQTESKPPPGFERVPGAPDTEKVDANRLVVLAYATFFVSIFGYVVWVARKQAQIAKEMTALSERIARAEKR